MNRKTKTDNIFLHILFGAKIPDKTKKQKPLYRHKTKYELPIQEEK